jgi:hypothetical protein
MSDPQPSEVKYNPSVKVYYGPLDEEHRLVPAPNISINHELIYANDIVIGYTPVLTLNGYATSLDLRYPVDDKVYGFTDTLENIQKLRNIINGNGKTLTVVDRDDEDNFVLQAIGGTIRSFSVNESENIWNNYAPYTAEIEFNEMWFGSCYSGAMAKPCGDIYEGLVDTPELVDMKKYRIKSFNDSFSIDLQPDQANENQGQLPCGGDDTTNTNNPNFNITYKISAVGKHYFDSDGYLMSAWEQAKRFVQYKINEQMKNRLRNGEFMERTGDTEPQTLGQLYSVAASGLGLISGIDFELEFDIFNETIQCEASEAEGSFSATYTAEAKRAEGDSNDVSHSFSKTISVSDDGSQKNVTITLDGTIQGLIKTGLTESGTPIELLDNGSMFLFGGSGEQSAYQRALAAFNEIGGAEGLTCDFVACVGITPKALGLDDLEYGECMELNCASPQTYSVTHNYTEGSINYTATFTTESTCDDSTSGYTNITISVEDSVDVIAEFIVPGRAAGPIIQKIGAKTPRKTTVNIEGATAELSVCCQTEVGSPSGTFGCDIALPSGVPPAEIDGLKLIENSITTNPIDGSFSVSRTYICCE